MAVAFDSGSSRTALTGDITVPSGSDRIFVLFVSIERNAGGSPTYSATLGGQSLTSATGSPATSSDRNDISTLYLLDTNFPSAGTQALTVTETGGAGLQGRIVGWMFFNGVAQSSPTYTEVNDLVTSDTVSIGSFSTTAGGACAAAMTEGGTGFTYTLSTGFVETWDFSEGGGDAHAAAGYRLYSSSGTDTAVFTRSSGAFPRACGAALILAAASGSGAISGTSAGIASTTATLTGLGALLGTSDGLAATTAVLTALGALSGSSAGLASTLGVLTGIAALSGQVSAIATADGTLVGLGALSGVVAGAGSVTGLLAALGALSGTSNGIATATGYLEAAGVVSPRIAVVAFSTTPFGIAYFIPKTLGSVQISSY